MTKRRVKPRVQPQSAAPAGGNAGRQAYTGSRLDLLIYLALLLVTFAVYVQVRHFDFVSLDDRVYTTDNVHVQQGLTAEGLAWALTARDDANWFPLTWVSHMLDYQLFGAKSGWHHMHNILLHALAAVLLCIFLQRATGTRWRSALVAFLFALHPMHVESVAWVAERKDVLSACFCFLTLWLYVRYAERRSLGRYLTVAFSFCLGLMAKPMLVTLPFVLLLLDYWPLARFRQPWRKAILEKLPLLVPSFADALITYMVQEKGGAMVEKLSFAIRLENAARSYAIYFLKTLWPSRLAVYYPFPREFSFFQILAAVLLLAAITTGVIVLRRRSPYLLAGWGWFMGTLIPVIGLVQVGGQAYADRYMYIPMVGLLIIVVWGVEEILERLHRQVLAVPLAATVCLACSVLTWIQVGYWRNSETLYRHALEVTDDNPMANYSLGVYLVSLNRPSEGLPYLKAAVKIIPGNMDAHNDLGIALARTGSLPEAITQFQIEIRMAPNAPNPHYNLGRALLQSGDVTGAITEFQTALRLDPANDEIRRNLALAQSRVTPGTAQGSGSVDPRLDHGMALLNAGNYPGAIAAFKSYLRIDPNNAAAYNDLGAALALTGRLPEAIDQFEAAVRLRPDFADAQFNLGRALTAFPNRRSEALLHLSEADRLRPNPKVEQMIAYLRAEQH